MIESSHVNNVMRENPNLTNCSNNWETVSGHSLTGGTNQSVQFLKNDWNSVENCNGPSSPHLSIFYQLHNKTNIMTLPIIELKNFKQHIMQIKLYWKFTQKNTDNRLNIMCSGLIVSLSTNPTVIIIHPTKYFSYFPSAYIIYRGMYCEPHHNHNQFDQDQMPLWSLSPSAVSGYRNHNFCSFLAHYPLSAQCSIGTNSSG